MIKFKLDRPNNKGFKCYFETVEDLKNFKLFLETLIKNAKKKGEGEQKQ